MAKGINFKEPLFHQVVCGEKTQTRRIIKYNDLYRTYNEGGCSRDEIREIKSEPLIFIHPEEDYETAMDYLLKHSRYRPGEKLYLKEPYRITRIDNIWFMNYLYISAKMELNISAGNNKIEKIHIQQEKAKSGWCNKLFMPEWCARYFIEITGVRCERLQDISDEDCLKEGAIGWLTNWAEKETTRYEQDFQYWINDRFHDDNDQAISYCEKCGEKEVRKLKKEAKKAGATKEELDDIFLDGGWDQESDYGSFCEGCGKRLQFSMCGDLGEYLKEKDYEFDKYSAYIIAQHNEEDLEKIQGLPRKACAALIDSISGKGTWESNPYVFVYDFKLTK
ncbi:MAG: hypothetical protein LBK58_11505 [Prevotellaceae bacterium]|jgi:hypothetical protein|nr:hypothetical protein [Prevotellaceae bacterium]